MELAVHFKVTAAVCINKFDINPAISESIARMAVEAGVPILGEIPYDADVTRAQIAGLSVVEYSNGSLTRRIKSLWQAMRHAFAPLLHTGGDESTREQPSEKEKHSTMRIAIPLTGGVLSAHFGHCEQFAIVDVDPERKQITSHELVTPPAHEPGVLPKWLSGMHVNLVIAGGMGQRAQQLFGQNRIEVLCGAPAATPEEIAGQYLAGRIELGENACDH